MKKKVKRRIFWLGLLVVVLGIGIVVYLWAPRFTSKEISKEYPFVKVYFIKGSKLLAVRRYLTPGETPLRKAMVSLLSGPEEAEVKKGITSNLPPGVKILKISRQGPIAIIDFNGELENYGGGSARLRGMIAQIVYTATEIPGIEKVWIWVEGRKEVVMGGEGLVLDHPLSRQEVRN